MNTIYEDDNLLVVNKPAGLAVFSDSSEETVATQLATDHDWFTQVGESPRHGIAHRLDKDTSGVLLIAKSDETLAHTQRQFKDRLVAKTYQALVVGQVPHTEDTIELLIGRDVKDGTKQHAFSPIEPDAQKASVRAASTHYKAIERFSQHTLLELHPTTGRKHQIRVHLAAIGFPIAKDATYGGKSEPELLQLTRQFLHASVLSIALLDGKTHTFEAPLPQELVNTLANLRK